jgi:hypothetical protein
MLKSQLLGGISSQDSAVVDAAAGSAAAVAAAESAMVAVQRYGLSLMKSLRKWREARFGWRARKIRRARLKTKDMARSKNTALIGWTKIMNGSCNGSMDP